MKFKKTYVWFVVLVVLMTGVLAACQSGFKVTYSAGENGTLTATADGESFVPVASSPVVCSAPFTVHTSTV